MKQASKKSSKMLASINRRDCPSLDLFYFRKANGARPSHSIRNNIQQYSHNLTMTLGHLCRSLFPIEAISQLIANGWACSKFYSASIAN